MRDVTAPSGPDLRLRSYDAVVFSLDGVPAGSRRHAVTFPSTLALLRRLRAAAIPTALVTAGPDSAALLESVGTRDVVDVRVERDPLALPDRPGSLRSLGAALLEAARLLEVEPMRSVVVEDTEVGVRAAVAGGFALVVGVDRLGNRAGLLAAGARVVVEDLGVLEVDVPVIDRCRHWCGGASPTADAWLLTYEGFDSALEGTREALCTLANGYWGTRGSVPGSMADGVHYPGTYLAGVYNRLSSDLGGRVVEDEHLVNAPDWTSLTLGPAGQAGGAAAYVHGSAQMLSCSQQLDVRRGLLTRVGRYRDAAGRTTLVTSRSFLHLTLEHLAVLETTVEAEDWSGPLVVRSGLDGRVANRNVAEYRLLADKHLDLVTAVQVAPDTVLLDMVTNQSQVHIAMAARTRARAGDLQTAAATRADADVVRVLGEDRRLLNDEPAYVAHEFTLPLRAGRPVTIEKVVAVATSRDRATASAALSAITQVGLAASVEDLLRSHVAGWERLWERFGVDISAGQRQSLALNLNTFHVLQAVAGAGPDLDAGVPARGLHGEGYRGHVFWDEVFVYPMLTLRRPELTRALLSYRYRRLDRARAAARADGLEGAMFPWQSGSDGREETPAELYNLRTNTWMPDNSRRQRHVGLAVAYGAWQYYQATADLSFLISGGAELMVEVTRFFASLAAYDATADRFDIVGVMGPDEFHDGYPDTPGQGVRNNAYTNVMVAWLADATLRALELLSGKDCGPLWDRLAVQPGERERWDRIGRRLRVPFHADGVISQFEGYEELEEFDWETYRARYGDIGRLDLILAAEGDTPNRYRLSKQADVLMLLYLLSAEELRAVLDRLDYTLSADAVTATVEFYLARTTHGSTLSRLVHSWVLARSDRPGSWSLFTRALDSDLADIQGGTTREGVHIGAMAGTVDMVLRCYGGLETRAGVLWLHPALPTELARATFEIVYRGQPISIDITRTRVRLRLHPHTGEPVTVCIENQISVLTPGQDHIVHLTPATPGQAPEQPPTPTSQT